LSMLYTFDFHNHSCLSPCASLEASPSEMVEWAIKKRIDLFALTDHNSALNSPAFGIECANAGIIPLFGIELNPFEEAHLLAIFSDPLTALRFSDWVFEYLPAMRVDPLQFGDQVVVDPLGQILSMPSSIWYGSSLKESFTFFAQEAAKAGAIVIPAHIDRPHFSVYSQLGFLPQGPYDAVEAMSPNPDPTLCGDFCVISNSDAHVLEHIGRRPSIIELDEKKVIDMHAALSKMAEAWFRGLWTNQANISASSPEKESEEDSEEDIQDQTSEAGLSIEIPGLLPIISFLEEWYPFAEAQALFENIRQSLHKQKAWSIYKKPKPGSLIHASAEKKK